MSWGNAISIICMLCTFVCVCACLWNHSSSYSHRVDCILLRYRSADKSLARPGREQARKHVRDARDFNNIETRAVIKIFFLLQGKATKEFTHFLTETLACFLPGWAKDLSATLYKVCVPKVKEAALQNFLAT